MVFLLILLQLHKNVAFHFELVEVMHVLFIDLEIKDIIVLDDTIFVDRFCEWNELFLDAVS